MKIPLLLFAVLLFGVSAPAEESLADSGNAFLRICSVVDIKSSEMTVEDSINVVSCTDFGLGVVAGFEEGLLFSRKVAGSHVVNPLCIPDGAQDGQLVRVVMKYIREHPETANKQTAHLVLSALIKAYSCH